MTGSVRDVAPRLVLRPVCCTWAVVVLGLCFGGQVLAAPEPSVAAQSFTGKSINDHASEFTRDYLSDPRRVGTLAGSILGGALTAHPAGTVLGSLVGFFIGKQSMFNEDDRPGQQQTGFAQRSIVPIAGEGVPVQTLSFSTNPGGALESAPVQTFPVMATLPLEGVSQVASGGSIAPARTPATVLSAPARTNSATPSLPPVAEATPPVVASHDAMQAVAPAMTDGSSVSAHAGNSPAMLATATPVPRAPLTAAVQQPAGLSREQIAAICSSGVRPVDARLRGLCFYHNAS